VARAQTHKGDVSDCIKRAAAGGQPTAPTPRSRKVELPATVDARIATLKQAMALGSWVKELRRQVFRSAAVPFRSRVRMERWLVGEGTRNGPPTTDGSGRLKSLAYRDMRRADELWVGFQGVPLFPASHLEVDRRARRGKGGASIWVAAGTGVEKLADATREMAQATGFSQPQLVALVLLGAELKPPVPKATVEYSPPHPALMEDSPAGPVPLYTRQVTMTMTEWDFSRATLAALFRKVQAVIGGVKSKPFTADDEKLMRMVSRMSDGKPVRHSMIFWKRARETWHKETGETRSADALRMSYMRIKSALKVRSERERARARRH
jgi:hypothetical protein